MENIKETAPEAENKPKISQKIKFSLNSRNKLKELFIKHFEAGVFTDCTIVAKCGKSLNLHRSILTAHSEYFEKLFLKRPFDVKPVFVFSELEFEDLERAVSFLYYGEFKSDSLWTKSGFLFALKTLHIEDFSSKNDDGTSEEANISAQSIPGNERSRDEPTERTTVRRMSLRNIQRGMAIRTGQPIGQNLLKNFQIVVPRIDVQYLETSSSLMTSASLSNDSNKTETVNETQMANSTSNRRKSVKEVSKQPKNFSCAFCANRFSRCYTRNRHQKICPQKPVLPTPSCPAAPEESQDAIEDSE